MGLLKGLVRVDRSHLSEEDRAQITNNIGALASMACSVSGSMVDGGLAENDISNLAYTSSLLTEIIGELNGLLQV